MVASGGPAADLARAEFRMILEEKDHAVKIAHRAVERLELAFAAGALRRTETLDRMLGDLAIALDHEEGQKLGGKSSEAARFVLRAVSRELDNA